MSNIKEPFNIYLEHRTGLPFTWSPIIMIFSLLFLMFLYSCGLAGYRLFWSPLARFPGPKLAAATGWFETIIDLWGNNFPQVLHEMHKKYGPIVRITPWEVHISDAEFYDQLFVTAYKRRTDISPISNPTTFSLGCKDSITSTKFHDLHRQRRKPLEGFFSRQGIVRIESVIHDETRLLEAKFQSLKGSGKEITLNFVYSSFTGDVIGKITCGESPRFLDSPDFCPEWFKTNRKMLEIIPLFRNFPWLSWLIRLVPQWVLKAITPSAASFQILALFSAERIEKIKAEVDNNQSIQETDITTSVFHHLLRSDIEESIKNVERLRGEAFVLVGAGTITTSSTLAIITYYILANPNIEERLRKDLKVACVDFPAEIPRWVELEKLPYLSACIKEGLRLNRHFRRQVRISPDTDLQYKQWTIPKKTPIGMSNYILQTDPEIYPEPIKFIPERWLDEYDSRMNRNWVPFSRGSRSCIGMNLSMAEMYIILSVIFRPGGYNISLVDCDESSILPVQDSDVGVAKRNSKGLKIKLN